MENTCPRRMEDFGPWEREEGLDPLRENGTCSFCGSLNHDRFMELVGAASVELTPTDKSYKVYVDGPDLHGKFYFQHLTVSQRERFVELINDKKLRLKDPGYFYVLPFFVVRK